MQTLMSNFLFQLQIWVIDEKKLGLRSPKKRRSCIINDGKITVTKKIRRRKSR